MKGYPFLQYESESFGQLDVIKDIPLLEFSFPLESL